MKSHLLRLVPVIESIEETKIIEDHHYSFVKFKDYEEQYNQWIPTHQLSKMKLTKELEKQIDSNGLLIGKVVDGSKMSSISKSTMSHISSTKSIDKSVAKSLKYGDNLELEKENIESNRLLGKRSLKKFRLDQDFLSPKFIRNSNDKWRNDHFKKLFDVRTLKRWSKTENLVEPDNMIMKRLKTKLEVKSAKITPIKNLILN